MSDQTMRVRLVADGSQYDATMKRSAGATRALGTEIAKTGTGAARGKTALGQYGSSASATATGTNRAAQGAQKLAQSLGLAANEQHKFAGAGKIALGVMSGYIGAQAIIGGVTAAFSALSNEVVGFDTNMRNVQSITHDTDAAIEGLGGQVLSLSDRLPKTASDLSDGLYEIASSGFYGAAGLKVLTASAEAAAAGLSTTGVAAKGITAILNAYGLGASQARDISDVLFQTVNLGVIRFDELSAQLGDFVGTAATLGVPIDDASSALATMTLNGINAAESSTSLNRVMLALIKPSDTMRRALRGLGYESGVSAVKALGLRGVMEALRTSTGGSVEAFSDLFPEVRGLRGALALTSNEGRTYARVSAQISDENKRHGATAAALREQQKALGYQVKVTWNNITNAVVAGSRSIVPALAAGLGDARDVIGDLAGAAAELLSQFGPGIEDIVAAAGDLGDILAALADGFGEVFGPAAAIAVKALAVAFNAVASALAEFTGFIAENRVLVEALGAVIAGKLVVSLAAAAANAGALIAYDLVGFFSGMANGARAAYTATSQLNTAMIGAGATGQKVGATLAGVFSPLTLAMAAAVGSVIAVRNSFEEADAAASKRIGKWEDRFDLESLRGLDRAISDATDRAVAARNRFGAEMGKGWGVGLGPTNPNTAYVRAYADALNPWSDNTIQRTKSAAEKWEKEVRSLELRQGRLYNNAWKALRRADLAPSLPSRAVLATPDQLANMDLAIAAANEWANVIGVDLSAKGKTGRDAIQQVSEAMAEAGQTGIVSGDAIKSGLISAEEAQAATDAWKKYADAISEGMSSTSDVVSVLGGKQGTTVADIRTFYADAEKTATTFLDNVQTAFAKGYDPNLVGRLLAAGPSAAGPILEALAQNTDANFTEVVNNAERKLAELNARAIEMGRLQFRALQGGLSDDQAAQLPEAIRVAQEKAVQGAGATSESIAAALKLTPEQVRSIAETYDINLPNLEIQVLVDEVTARSDLESIRTAIGEIPDSVTSTAEIRDPQDAQEWWARLKGRLMEVPGLQETVAQINDPQQALLWWISLRERINQVPTQPIQTGATVTVNGDTGALDTIATKLRWLAALGVVRVGASISGAFDGGATGAIFTPAHSFAWGGMAGHQPKIWRAADGYQFNEPETHGEALIPLADDARRPRATSILSEVAGRFGYGLVRVSNRNTSSSSRVVKIHAPISLSGTFAGENALVATIDRKLVEHLDEIERAVSQG